MATAQATGSSRNTKRPSPGGKRGRAAKADPRLLKIHQQWAERHPGLAAELRGMRLEQIDTAKRYDHVNIAGTPETNAKARRTLQGSLARLFMAGDIDAQQLAWAAEIASVYELITREVSVRIVNFETRVDTSKRRDGAFFEKLGQVRAEMAYTRWREQLVEPWPVLAMIVEDVGVSVAARQFRMRNGRAKKLLIDALELWGTMIEGACRDIDSATLLAAQAAIL